MTNPDGVLTVLQTEGYRRLISEQGRLRRSAERVAAPQRRQILVRLMAASVNFRDGLISAGKNFRGSVPDNIIPLSDAAGFVVAVGTDVTRWKVGDRIASTFMPRWVAGEIDTYKAAIVTGTAVDGVLVRHRLFDEEEVVRIPDHLDFAEAATLPTAALTAWSAINGPTPVRAGETVLVLGTGGVSTFACQFALAAGARVIVTSSSDDKIAMAARLGVTEGINYVDTPEWQLEVRSRTDQRGADHVVETHGAGTVEKAIAACRMGGQVLFIGTKSTGQLDASIVLRSRVVVRSVTVGSHEAFAQMNRCLSLHRLRPVIHRAFPFAQAEAAIAYLRTGAHFGKVVVNFDA
ncbi:NAD(P)-dependent alcohol dehydrogenase [soil metagenome]